MSALFELESQTTMAFPEPLTEQFRPRRTSDFIGLDKPKKFAANLVKMPKPCSLLFVGEPGCGKTTFALALADELNAQVHHIGSQQCVKEQLQREIESCEYGAWDYKTGESKSWHVIIVDEADLMSVAAQAYLLSKLDATERSPRIIWIFTANSVERLESRFLSRCLCLDFSSHGSCSEVASLLARIWAQKAPSGVPEPDFKRIATKNVRESLSRLEVELMTA